MRLCQTLRVWGAASVALFSVSAFGQMIVEKGNHKNPHQPPEWFSNMAKPEIGRTEHANSIRVDLPENRTIIGNPHHSTGAKYCPYTDSFGREQWRICRG